VRGTAVCFNLVTNSSFNVSVDLTAIATGELESFKQNDRFFDSVIVLSQASGVGRTADVSGIISDGSQNFVPDTSLFAFIQRVSEGLLIIQPPGLPH
jgi:hypothetical protein